MVISLLRKVCFSRVDDQDLRLAVDDRRLQVISPQPPDLIQGDLARRTAARAHDLFADADRPRSAAALDARIARPAGEGVPAVRGRAVAIAGVAAE